MNHQWDTPPDGDFVRYLERMSAPSPGQVMQRARQAAAQQAAARTGTTRPAAIPTAARSPSAVPRAPAGQPAHMPQGPAAGPPDLATIFRALLGQIGGELKKPPGKR